MAVDEKMRAKVNKILKILEDNFPEDKEEGQVSQADQQARCEYCLDGYHPCPKKPSPRELQDAFERNVKEPQDNPEEKDCFVKHGDSGKCYGCLHMSEKPKPSLEADCSICYAPVCMCGVIEPKPEVPKKFDTSMGASSYKYKLNEIINYLEYLQNKERE